MKYNHTDCKRIGLGDRRNGKRGKVNRFSKSVCVLMVVLAWGRARMGSHNEDSEKTQG